MAANVDEHIDHIEAHVETESTALLTDGHTDTGRRSGSCRRRLLFLGRLLLHLGCLGYNLYLIWLLAYLKDNPYYWFLSLIPLLFNLLVPLIDILDILEKIDISPNSDTAVMFKILLTRPSLGVFITLMSCFTMLTRFAYYHRQPDEFIGPRFIIMSLQGSTILFLLDFYLEREGKLENLLKEPKDALNRMLLDFVDIFNMVELLSANDCVGVGSFVTENSSTEKAIQAFCLLSFFTLWFTGKMPEDQINHDDLDPEERVALQVVKILQVPDFLYFGVIFHSVIFQNLPFLVIRIIVWVQYKMFSLGFLVKNVYAIVICIMQYQKVRSHELLRDIGERSA